LPLFVHGGGSGVEALAFTCDVASALRCGVASEDEDYDEDDYDSPGFDDDDEDENDSPFPGPCLVEKGVPGIGD
jgi:hypothetical protein